MSLRSPYTREKIYEEEVAIPPDCYIVPGVDLSNVRDQKQQTTCAAIVGATIKEIYENRKGEGGQRLSSDFLYEMRSNAPETGMYGRNVFHILQAYGIPSEQAYMAGLVVPEDAASRRISSYVRITSLGGLRHALLELGACYLLLPMYGNWKKFWRQCEDAEEPIGHAITVVGYNHKGFILQNSWGPQWNDNGLIIFPYKDWGVVWECWAAIEKPAPVMQKKGGGCQVL
jgi:hypothetical protein